MSSTEAADYPTLDERIHDLVREKRFDAAIRLAVEENAANRDPSLEQQLIDLRIRGFNALERTREPPPWPPEHSNRFAAVEGIPEVSADELDADALLSGILGKGGLIVRGLMDPRTVDSMRRNIDRSFDARLQLARKEIPEGESEWFRRSESVPGGPVQFATLGSGKVTGTGSIWCVDCPPAAFELTRFYHRLGLPRILESYFNEPATLSVRKWVLRIIEPNNGAEAGWHQDGRFLGDESIRTVNLWVALTDCGEGASAPGIDIVGGNERHIHETGTRGAAFDWTVGQEIVDEICESQTVARPRFAAGDAVFFDHYNLHRTGFGLNDTCNRYAVESWFFARSTAPAGQQPLLL